MKLEVKITSVNKEDLVNLLSTACYGSYIFACKYKTSDYYNTELESEGDTKEDKLAKVLLSGKPIKVYDCQAEDEDEFYGNLPHKWNKIEEAMGYTVTLQDIINGIEKASNNGSYDAVCANALIANSPSFDACMAENLMQIITFGEAVYG